MAERILHYSPKSDLNEIQKARAPKSVSNEAFAADHQAMVAEGYPRKATPLLNLKDAATGATSKTWRDKESGKLIYEVTYADQSRSRIEATSFAGLDHAIDQYNAQFAEPVVESERARIVGDWIANFRFGKEYAALAEALPDARAHELTRVIQDWGRKKYGNLYATQPQRFEQAYIDALDAGAVDIFEQEAELHRQLAEQDAKEQGRLETKRAEKIARKTQGQAERFAECERIEAERVRKEEIALGATPEGLSVLRRHAIPSISGQKIETTPLSGTRLRPEQTKQ